MQKKKKKKKKERISVIYEVYVTEHLLWAGERKQTNVLALKFMLSNSLTLLARVSDASKFQCACDVFLHYDHPSEIHTLPVEDLPSAFHTGCYLFWVY